MNKVLAICLDGYDHKLGIELINAGEMPALKALLDDSATFTLDHGPAYRTGLAGEHFATGLSPEDSGRFAAVHFDRDHYDVWQEGTSTRPFPSGLTFQTVVFDATYFDLDKADDVRGMVSWGAHDPGSPPGSHPTGLMNEIHEKFGRYPAEQWIYGLAWNSVDDSKAMGTGLAEAVDLRANIAQWLFTERIPDWDLALLTVSEAHSVIEGLWHGVDPDHPLHSAPSAAAAGHGVQDVYRAIDRLIGRLRSRLPGVTLVVFSMHGMGPNRSDAASFLLLAELLYRDRFNRPLFNRQGESSPGLNGQVELPEGESWLEWIDKGYPAVKPFRQRIERTRTMLKNRRHPNRIPIDWIPATRYQRFWPRMRVFALPAYYDGRISINLRGRERNGLVPLEDFETERERVASLVRECRDLASGREIAADIEFTKHPDPLDAGETDCDLQITWKNSPLGIRHPRLGQIGPVPYRRTGGHSGGDGFTCLLGAGLPAAEHGRRSSFDIVPTLLELLGDSHGNDFSGASLLMEKSL